MMKNLDYFNEFLFRHETGSWFMKPVCDFFQLNYDNQVEKIKKDKICQTDTGKFLSEQLFGDKRPRLTLQNRGFARWVQMTSSANIRVELREKFEIFQANIFDYLWKGTEAKNLQLEDIRMYALNINNAINIRNHIMEYVGEQKRHRDLCLASSPAEWLQMRSQLVQGKAIPKGTQKLVAIDTLPNNIDELKRIKQNQQTNVLKNKHRLLYQSAFIMPKENPMPEGYRREHLKHKIKQQQAKVDAINKKLVQLETMEG